MRRWLSLAFSCILVVLGWMFSSDWDDYSPPLMTHDGNHLFNFTDLYLPNSKSEIVELVREAYFKQKKIRVLGSGHSVSPLAVSEGITLALHNFRGVVSINVQAKQITVKAGTKIKEIIEILDEHGLAVSVLSSITDQTVAGAIMTPTHGTGIKHGVLATLVVSLEMVTATGEVLLIHKDDELFPAALINVGLLGVITKVTLQAEPAFNLKEVTTVMPLKQCISEYHDLTTRHEYTKMWINLLSNSCLVISAHKVTDDPQLYPLAWLNFKMHIFEVMQWIMSLFPSLTAGIMSSPLGTSMFFLPRARIDKSHRIFNIPLYVAPVMQQEVAVSIEDCQEILKLLHNFVHVNKIPVNEFLEVRNVKSDDFWLSPSYGRNSCYLAQLLFLPSYETYQQYYSGYFNLLFTAGYQPRLHWGKVFNLTASQVNVLYPRFKDFLAVKERLDPIGIFTNFFLKNLFQPN